MSKKQFPSFRVSAAPPLRGWRERSKKQFPSFRSAPPQIGERSKKQFPSFRSAPSQVGERSKKQFPSFRSVPPQVGERFRGAKNSFRVSEFPQRPPSGWREAFSKKVARTIQDPRSRFRASPRILGVEQIPRTGSGLPDSRFRASPRIWGVEQIPTSQISPSRIQISRLSLGFRNCKTKYKFQIPAQQFLFPLLHSRLTSFYR